MDLFEKQAQIHSLFQRSPVDAAYTQGTASGRRLAGAFSDLDVALLLLDKVKTNEFFDYQVYFVSELSKTLETQGLEVVILNQASLLQRAQVIKSWNILYQRDVKRRVQWETRAVMEYLEFQKYDDIQSKALAERTKSDRFAIDPEYVKARLARLREQLRVLAQASEPRLDVLGALRPGAVVPAAGRRDPLRNGRVSGDGARAPQARGLSRHT